MANSGRRVIIEPQVYEFSAKEGGKLHHQKKTDKDLERFKVKNFPMWEVSQLPPQIAEQEIKQICQQQFVIQQIQPNQQFEVEIIQFADSKNQEFSQQKNTLQQPISKVFNNIKLMEQEYYVQEFVLIKLGILQNFVNTCESSAVIMHFQVSEQKIRADSNTKASNRNKSLTIKYTTQALYFPETKNNIQSQTQEYFQIQQKLFLQFTNELHQFIIKTLKQMSISIKLNQTLKQVVKKINELRNRQRQKEKDRQKEGEGQVEKEMIGEPNRKVEFDFKSKAWERQINSRLKENQEKYWK